MKLLWGKNNLFQSPSPKIPMLETSGFARPALRAPILKAGLGGGFFWLFFMDVLVASGTRVPLKQIKGF